MPVSRILLVNYFLRFLSFSSFALASFVTGAVYFIVSAMVMIFVNLGEREEGEWSAYR